MSLSPLGLIALTLFYLVDPGQASQGVKSGHTHPKGLFPNVFNLATDSSAVITVNATCGETGPETYCKLVEHVFLRNEREREKTSTTTTHRAAYKAAPSDLHCGVCDASSVDKKHPITYAIDGTNRYWQSPSLQHGRQFEWVTITLDLGQVYQVAYIILKSAISPRPGNWILERSLDGIIYTPWQYYAESDAECWEAYGISPTIGKPHYRRPDEVICTSYYSKLDPLENGEIHTSLVNGRPGADIPTEKIREFTMAKYVRLRLQKIRTLNADLMSLQNDNTERVDESVTRRYFYSIKDISVGGQCMCSGHASECSIDRLTGKQQCKCKHHTCGKNCEVCCPLYNQKAYKPGTNSDAAPCIKCQCYGHADSCHFDTHVAYEKMSINTEGKYEGGGVCENCKHHTTGINCEKCQDTFYRPTHIPRNDSKPCIPCKCTGPGMSGLCVKDDSNTLEGLNRSVLNFNLVSPLVQTLILNPGDCLCKAGFEGKYCDRCAVGFQNYPLCEPCPCHSAGTLDGTCEGECVCKAHVEGSRCDRCKRGFYHLSADNPDGCSQCFCFGLTDECIENDWGVEIIKNLEDWHVSDLKGTRVIKPLLERRDVVVANDDMSEFSNYYWLAPQDYLGKKLYSYGADLKFSVSYTVARGDTSGTYTESADVVLEGNGMKLGYNWAVRPELDYVTIIMPLREQGWFFLDSSGKPLGSVNREEFTLALNNLSRLLIRAKFHTDQIEGRIHDIGMEIASKESKSIKQLKSVEKCMCPPGYSGLSCEFCAVGYREIKNIISGILCERCDCYSHAKSCDADTGLCENCLHNTTGEKCDKCIEGYYGYATTGTVNDCKKCACPLEEAENNFSPTCVAVESGEHDYHCDKCPPGYEGNKCERCSEGFFGNPQIPGGLCQPCECSRNADISQPGWCDTLTGQCNNCLGNTGGWSCGECLPDHYGDPIHRSCRPCLCNILGSLSTQCDHSTGQCICKEHFTGRMCDHCIEGYGNIEAGCVLCKCNTLGSKSVVCDAISGSCMCKPGVFGTTCDFCLENHYGFSHHGCRECQCNQYGSTSLQCDQSNGQCPCKNHVVGLFCDECEDGYWNMKSLNCVQCHCNRTGAIASLCNKITGQCSCKPGVGGSMCDQCLPGYFKFSSRGCRKCDPCNVPGHICDPNSGRCVCPPFTTGRRCQNCVPNAWGYDTLHGCKPCNCNSEGSPSQRCDPATGNCICLESFGGQHCDQCRHGFYNFPKCHKCDCNPAGTDVSRCEMKDNVCQCNKEGHCFCKEHVTGKKCNKCKEDAFGLNDENPKGCHKCFCFGRTHVCNQANMYWDKISFPAQEVFFEVGTSEFSPILGFKVIPQEERRQRLGIPYILDKPLYWSLPKEKLGDKVLSYNGFLKFYVESHSSSHFPDALLQSYPLVVLQGNQRIVLVHSYPHTAAAVRRPYEIRFHEDAWKNFNNPQIPVTKDALMIALQSLQTILIRATDGPDVKYSRLHNITIDFATAAFESASLAEGVEACHCPRMYTGTSCQDPAPGYYRKRKPNYLDSKDILDLVGHSEPCVCNNHTHQCEAETGVCINCGGNTIGDHCERCKKGHYGDPTKGPCRPCACPHVTNSFSDMCIPDSDYGDYICIDCQVGYTGRHCEKCETGYYGNPQQHEGRCVECKCNPYGSKSRDCDQITGQCHCREGITGQDCTICSAGFILTEYGCKSCEDECTGVLLKELYNMKLKLEELNVTDLPKLPWGYLKKMTESEMELRPLVDNYQEKISAGKELINNFTFYFDLESKADGLLIRAMEFMKGAISSSSDGRDTLEEAEKLFLELNNIWRSIKDLASELDRHGEDPAGLGLSTERMLITAEQILQELKNRNFKEDKESAQREMRKALNLIDKINQLTRDRGHIDDAQERINVLNGLLQDTIGIITEDVQRPTSRALESVRGGQLRLNEVQGTVGHISEFIDACNSTLKEAADLLGEASSFIIDADVKFEYLPRFLRELENTTNKLDEHRGILSSLNPIYKTKYVIPAQEHAEELDKQSNQLAERFVATKESSEFPLQAANAYQNIVNAINAAEKAARDADKAADRAYQEAYPGTDDALISQAEKARLKSMQLLSDAERLNEESVPELEIALKERKRDLNRLSEDASFARKENDFLNDEMDLLPTGLKKELEEANYDSQISGDKAEMAKQKIDRIENFISKDLKPKFDAIHAGTNRGLENLTKIINKAREDVRGASHLADSADDSANRVRKYNDNLKLDLKILKDKILLARQKASSIHVALTTDKKKQCFRSYKPPPVIKPTTTNNIVLNYAIESSSADSLLFYLGSSHEEDFMAIEMFNRKIRFLWNAGGGTQVIQHNMTIETNSNQLLNNNQWYKIEVNRIGNLAMLSVKRTPEGEKPDPYEVSGASPVGHTKMDLDINSNLFVGGFPENYLAPNELHTSSFAGCLYTLQVDGQSIGLWNFISSIGCDGCKEGATEDIDISAYQFVGGNSYAIVLQNPYYRKSDLYTVMSFKTLNEDALLFLSCNPKSGHLISLELKKGKVVFQLKFGTHSSIYLETNKKYNTGQWIRLEAAREKFEAEILVEDELLEKRGSIQGSSALDLKDNALFYGGVPPNFTKESWPGITFKSFFGCFRDLQMDSTPIALSRGSFYGMSLGCSNKALKSCTFNGAGYLELSSHPISLDSSFSFSFLSQQRNAILVLSTFIGKDSNPDILQNYYSISLRDGRIETRIGSYYDEISMLSDSSLASGTFHTVNLIRKNRRLLLFIDDKEEAEIRLPRGAKDVIAPKIGGLFFGGAKDGIVISTMAASHQPFIGIIEDVIFNDRLLKFEDAVGYSGVDFGFSDIYINKISNENEMAVSHMEDRCISVDMSVDDSAFRPSNHEQDFAKVEIEKIEKNPSSFNITFEFRTYFMDGILLFAKTSPKKQELSMYLRNNSLIYTVRIKKKNQNKIITTKDIYIKLGLWNRVELLKSRGLSLYVNHRLVSHNDFNKKLHLQPNIYIGGAPQNLINSERGEHFAHKTQFHGCIRNFHINNILYTPKAKFPCFKNSEPGSYFSGEGFVTYDSAFYLSNVFVVKLDFRPSEAIGDLLYIFSNDDRTKMFLRLEIIDNQVLATLYSEHDLQKIQLSRNLEDECDKRWHTLYFSYKEGNLSLKLDDQKPVDKALKKLFPSLKYVEVYIGGRPKKYSKDIMKNYVGCMKNIHINDEILDLRNSEDSRVIQHSCPSS